MRAIDLAEHEIILLKSARPVKQRYFTVSEKLKKVMHDVVEKLKDKGIAKSLEKPRGDGKKPSGEYRMCIDFRIVNKLSKRDAFQLPKMDVIFNKLKKARYI